MHSQGSIGAFAASIVLTCALVLPALAAGNQVLTVKAGYVNLSAIKRDLPQLAVFERIKQDADNQLRAVIFEANRQLSEATRDKKSKEELATLQSKLQTEVGIRQAALSDLVNSQSGAANRVIAEAVRATAKEKGLDFVLDSDGVFMGNDQLTANATDITEPVKKRLTAELSGATAVAPKEPEKAPEAKPTLEK
jgi:Skp family chaperone for outer membrane proteins